VDLVALLRDEEACRTWEAAGHDAPLRGQVRQILEVVDRGGLLHDEARRSRVEEAHYLPWGDEAARPYQVRDESQAHVPILVVVVLGAFQEAFQEAFRDEVEEGTCKLEEDDGGSEAFLGECDFPLVGLYNSFRRGRVASGSEVLGREAS